MCCKIEIKNIMNIALLIYPKTHCIHRKFSNLDIYLHTNYNFPPFSFIMIYIIS